MKHIQGLVAAASLVLGFGPVVHGQTPGVFTESEESLAVAGWLRVANSPAAEASFTGIIGGPSPARLAPLYRDGIVINGAEAFLADGDTVAAAAADLRTTSLPTFALAASGGLSWSRNVHNVPWGLVEGPRDVVTTGLLDAVVIAAQEQGVNYVATFAPFAAWALSCRSEVEPECEHFLDEDIYYLASEGRMELTCEPDQIPELLGQLAERYDADGVGDAPGLKAPVRYWQMGNEVEANATCGGYLGDLDAYLAWVGDGGAAIRNVCPGCQIVLGGALATDRHEQGRRGLQFWRDFVVRGGGEDIDIVAIHYNNGKTGNDSIEDFENMIETYVDIFGPKPMWVTEFGVLTGEDAGGFVHLPEREAAGWYLRYYATGLAAGVERFFSDWIGFVDRNEIQLTYWTNKLCGIKLAGFTGVEKLAQDQIRFSVDGQDVLAVWGDGELPAEYARVPMLVTGIDGWTRIVTGSDVLPSAEPVFAEPIVPRRPTGRQGG